MLKSFYKGRALFRQTLSFNSSRLAPASLSSFAFSQTVGVPRERFPDERRVAVSPEGVEKLRKMGYSVRVESNAGAEAKFIDAAYEKAGAEIVDAASAFGSDIVLKVRAPLEETADGVNELKSLRSDSTLISFVYPQ